LFEPTTMSLSILLLFTFISAVIFYFIMKNREGDIDDHIRRGVFWFMLLLSFAFFFMYIFTFAYSYIIENHQLIMYLTSSMLMRRFPITMFFISAILWFFLVIMALFYIVTIPYFLYELSLEFRYRKWSRPVGEHKEVIDKLHHWRHRIHANGKIYNDMNQENIGKG